MKGKLVITAILLYVLSAGVSYVLFNTVLGKKTIISAPVPQATKTLGEKLQFDESLPKTEVCPLNGQKYSVQQKQWWEKHRPLGVMIENSKDARPQSGISYADVVYEALAEGGITRTMNVFYCQDAGIVGPVRSARTYFLDYISEYANYPLYAHVGGANTPGPADALGQIDDYGWQSYNDLNQFSIGFPTYWRDYERLGHEVATEHTMYSSTEKLWKVGETRGLTNVDKKGNKWDADFVPYKFKEDASVAQRPASQSISFSFSENFAGDYSVQWDYDKATNTYLRTNGGAKHIDKDTGKQLAAKDIVILFETERRANDGYEGNLHELFGTKGTGKALIFMDGKEVQGTWSKKTRTSRTVLKDSTGKEVPFNPGLIWFEILPIGNDVTVK